MGPPEKSYWVPLKNMPPRAPPKTPPPRVRADALRDVLLLPSPSLVHHTHPQASFRGRAGACARQFRALRIGRQGDSVQQWNCPTQAKKQLEWATREPDHCKGGSWKT